MSSPHGGPDGEAPAQGLHAGLLVDAKDDGARGRALVLRPRYLLLDEVTSALDVEHIDRLLTVLAAMKNEGLAIVFVTHLLGFARRLADVVVFLDEGRVVESGDPSILKHPQSTRLTRFLSMLEAAG